ncbi:hypothetical protein E1218_15600 [Kribbella turkmenica]|uniref:Uncharacterized protein n=1 Tax=Kribbella turkmenica TaxID=2530375 RepID=A0A4R4X402_9ACTN|nr:hypothetical protein [Kribbella turkmenica]TDD25036.1 hypothetical protein E1218_15600 [Kribbella turkmenica]
MAAPASRSRVTGLKVVHADTGLLLGAGSTLGREFCAVLLNNICTLNVLWPLWDANSRPGTTRSSTTWSSASEPGELKLL